MTHFQFDARNHINHILWNGWNWSFR